jgi:hypothetical protein
MVSSYLSIFERIHNTSSSCLFCSFKCRRKRSSHKEFLHSPIYPYTIYNFRENIPNNIIHVTFPPSNASSQYADDIQLTVLSTPRDRINPHYTLPLRRITQETHI